jgi:glycosidase
MKQILRPWLLLLALLTACGATPAARPTAPATAPAAVAPTQAAPPTVAPSPTQAASSEPDLVATIAAMGPTAEPPRTPEIPTVPPTITTGPAAEPKPLPAGWWDGAVCYEVFVRSFYDSDGDGVGDLNGLAQKLDYISDGDPKTAGDLGANCIWLMPIADSPSYHGYDVADYYKVDPDYGTNDDFKRLVDEAHGRGIKVVLDLVLNHTSSQHPWFQEALRDPQSPYRDYYIFSRDDPGYKGPWGEQVWHKSPLRDEYYYGIFYDGMPDLNYRNPAVTAEAQKISAFWANDMGADGFRLDAIKHAIEDGPVQENTPETHAWLRDYKAFLEKSAPVFTVGEIFSGSLPDLQPYYPDQLDTYFAFAIGGRILDAARNGSAAGFLSSAQSTNELLPFQRYAPFLTNHDQERALSELGGDIEKARAAAVALLTLPGLPFVYYGEEIGMLGTKPDEFLRAPMQWTGSASGFTTGTPWEALGPGADTNNVAAQGDDPASLLNLYRRLINLHTANPALAQGSFTPLDASDRGVAAFIRRQGDDAVLVLINFGDASAAGVTLSVAKSDLDPGAYELTPLLGDAAGAPLTTGAGGSLQGYVPLPTLAPHAGYIFALTRRP